MCKPFVNMLQMTIKVSHYKSETRNSETCSPIEFIFDFIQCQNGQSHVFMHKTFAKKAPIENRILPLEKWILKLLNKFPN